VVVDKYCYALPRNEPRCNFIFEPTKVTNARSNANRICGTRSATVGLRRSRRRAAQALQVGDVAPRLSLGVALSFRSSKLRSAEDSRAQVCHKLTNYVSSRASPRDDVKDARCAEAVLGRCNTPRRAMRTAFTCERDAALQGTAHLRTRLSEFFKTRLLRFKRVDQPSTHLLRVRVVVQPDLGSAYEIKRRSAGRAVGNNYCSGENAEGTTILFSCITRL
jgi:hypothetical protein